jgi:putative glcNAc transferase
MKSKKRILVISNLFPSEKDPSYGTFVALFTHELQGYSMHYKTDLCVIKGRTTSKICKLLKYFWFYSSITLHILFHHYALIYVHYITYSSIPLLFLSKIKKLNIVFNIHGDDLLTKSKVAENVLQAVHKLLINSKLVVVPSEFFKDILIDKFKDIRLQNIFVSPSGGIEKSFYNEMIAPVQSPFTIGYVSRIDTGKGWDILLRAIQDIYKEHPIQVKIAGTGRQVEELKHLISTLNLSHIVTYYGALSHAELPQFYTNLTLFVFPTTLKESLGLVGLEAMAASKPVIGSAIGGLKSYIKDGYNGFLIPPGNSRRMGECIVNYINLPDERKLEMNRNAFKTAQLYQSNIVIKKLIERLMQCIDQA